MIVSWVLVFSKCVWTACISNESACRCCTAALERLSNVRVLCLVRRIGGRYLLVSEDTKLCGRVFLKRLQHNSQGFENGCATGV
jgi:hypothetical protein